MTKNIYITGGSGQDGQILTTLLKKKKINLTVIYKGKKPKSTRNVNFLISNLLNKKKIDLFFKKKKPDIVLHLAAHNPSYHEKNNKVFFKQNFLATKNIFYSTFEANRKAKFLFFSSSQVFKKKTGIVNEQSKVSITTDYTKFRIQSHNLMLKYKKKNYISYSNIILFNHDSVFRNQKFIIPRMIKAIIDKKIYFLNKIFKKNIASDFSHAEDICNAITKIMFSKKNLDIVILSSGKLTSLNNVIFNVIKKNKINLKLKYPIKPIKGLIGDNTLSKKMFKWRPKKNIYKAANEIYLWYKKLIFNN